MLHKLVVILGILATATVAKCSSLPIETLDVPFLSRLRFETKWAAPITQCALFWSGIQEKLGGGDGLSWSSNNENTYFKQIDLKVLQEVHDLLKRRDGRPFVNTKLDKFTLDCISMISKRQFDSGNEISPQETYTAVPMEEETTTQEPIQAHLETNAQRDLEEEDRLRRESIQQQFHQRIMSLENELSASKDELNKLRNRMEANRGEFGNCKADLQMARDSIKQLQYECNSRLETIKQSNNKNSKAEYERQYLDQQLSANKRELDELRGENGQLRAELRRWQRNFGPWAADFSDRQFNQPPVVHVRVN